MTCRRGEQAASKALQDRKERPHFNTLPGKAGSHDAEVCDEAGLGLCPRVSTLAGMLPLIDARSQLTAPEGRFRVDRSSLVGIAVHHSVSGDALTERATEADEVVHLLAIDRYHVDQGFGGIGYHLAVFASGRVYQLGSFEGARAHVAGRNHELLGVVAIGTFTGRPPGQLQRIGLQEAVTSLRQYAGRPLPVRGHDAWALAGQGTLCPGRLREIDWDEASLPAPSCMVRFNAIAPSLENLELPYGMRAGVLAAKNEFALPLEARAVRIEVALHRGGFAWVMRPMPAESMTDTAPASASSMPACYPMAACATIARPAPPSSVSAAWVTGPHSPRAAAKTLLSGAPERLQGPDNGVTSVPDSATSSEGGQ